MARSRRFLAVSALAAVLAAACTNEDSDRADVVDALEQAGASQDEADCVGTRLSGEDADSNLDLSSQELTENQLSQGELNDVANASELGEIEDADVREAVQAVMDLCFGVTSSDEDTEDPETTDESTTTTEG